MIDLESGYVTISGRVILKFRDCVLVVIERSRIAKVWIEPDDLDGRTRLCWLYHDTLDTTWAAGVPNADGISRAIFDSIIYEHEDVIWQQVFSELSGGEIESWRRNQGRLT